MIFLFFSWSKNPNPLKRMWLPRVYGSWRRTALRPSTDATLSTPAGQAAGLLSDRSDMESDKESDKGSFKFLRRLPSPRLWRATRTKSFQFWTKLSQVCAKMRNILEVVLHLQAGRHQGNAFCIKLIMLNLCIKRPILHLSCLTLHWAVKLYSWLLK